MYASQDPQANPEYTQVIQEMVTPNGLSPLLLDAGYKPLGKREHPLELKIAEMEAQNLGLYAVEYEGFANLWGDNDQLVGGLLLHRRWNTASLYSFWLEPEFRGLDLGKVLLEASEQVTLAMGARAIMLETSTLHNYEFYLRNGFIVTSEITGYIDGHSHFLMLKDLGHLLPRDNIGEVSG